MDSKATPYSLNIQKTDFFLSVHEFKLMSSSDTYIIARVFDVTTDPEIRFVKLSEEELLKLVH